MKKNIIVSTAAELICEDIMKMSTSKTMYPFSSDVESLENNASFIEKSLLDFLLVLLDVATLQLVSIGQAIILACRPIGNYCTLIAGVRYIDAPKVRMSIFD